MSVPQPLSPTAGAATVSTHRPPHPHDPGPTGSPRLHTPGAAARLLSVPESWLRRKAGQRLIPCTFVGRHLRFSNSDLHAIIEAGAQRHRLTRRR
jgi:excisionase family DNA binding protein